MNGAVDFLTRLGPARIAAMGVVTLALVGFFAFVIMRVSQPTMGVLYADLASQDASAVMKDLDARAIPCGTPASYFRGSLGCAGSRSPVGDDSSPIPQPLGMRTERS